jgi:hypothetical protein
MSKVISCAILLGFSVAAAIAQDSGPSLAPVTKQTPIAPKLIPIADESATPWPSFRLRPERVEVLHYSKSAQDPNKTEKTAAEPRPSSSSPDVSSLRRQAAALKGLIESLEDERTQVVRSQQEGTPADEAETMKMRVRLTQLLTKLGAQAKRRYAAPEQAAPTPAVPERNPGKGVGEKEQNPGKPAGMATSAAGEPTLPPGQGPKWDMPKPQGKPLLASTDKPVDPAGLAEALFRTGDFEGALASYRLIDLEHFPKADRTANQYMMACCLRRLGRIDEAAVLYREVVNAKDDPVLADCARWQLEALSWRRDLEAQLRQVQQRRQAMEIKP